MFQVGDQVVVKLGNVLGEIVEVSTWRDVLGRAGSETLAYLVQCDNWRPPTRWLHASNLEARQR